ncbi:MAG: DEAD/DEAH box helicase [Paludibacteraceae bacterium]|nr:DEAD/DEAH box helicase [Paludibacteraceae bacterium]
MFAVLIIDHRLLGYIFQPCLLEKGKAFYKLSGKVVAKSEVYEELTSAEKELVTLCDAFSESALVKRFSKDKITFYDFVKRCERNPKECDKIIPFIERNVYKIASFLMEHLQIPIFFKTKNYDNIYESDRIFASASFAQSLASFELVEENGLRRLLYSLKIFQDGEMLELKNPDKGRPNILLSNEPGCAIVENRLCVFEAMSLKRLMPFFTKPCVQIEEALLENYMHTFVKKSIKEGMVLAKGFEVQTETPAMYPVLTLMEDLGGMVALRLHFQYGEQMVEESNPSLRIVTEKHTPESYKFCVLNRDIEAEKRYQQILLDLDLKKLNFFYYLKKNLVDGRSILHEMVSLLLTNKVKLKDFKIEQDRGEEVFLLAPVSSSISIGEVKQTTDWFDIEGMVQIGDFQIPFYKFRNHIIEGNREYKLPDGTIVLLPEEWFTNYSKLLEFSVEEEGEIRINRMYFNLLNDTFPSFPKSQHLSYQLERQRELPAGIRAELRSYQKVGYSWLVSLYENHFGGCLADDMGLGKTIQFLTFFQFVYSGGRATVPEPKREEPKSVAWPYATAQPNLFDQLMLEDAPQPTPPVATVTREKKPASLVVLPTSLLFNWQREKEKFAPELRSLTYSGSKRIRSKDVGRIFNHYDLIFTTYGILRNDIDFIKEYTFECILLDESQNIKNPDSYNYKTVIQVKANHHFVISGTPIENSLKDLWSQMNFANRNIFGSQAMFNKQFLLPIVKQKNEQKEKQLQQLIKPFILRRTKSEVATDLPPMIEQTILCEMTEEHRSIYMREQSSMRNEFLDSVTNSTRPVALLAITALLRLRQLSNHPALVMPEYEGESSKMEEVVSRIESLRAEGHKVLVFSSFVKHLNLLEERLQQIDIRYEKLTGETSNREEIIQRFQTNKEIVCFLISLKAGGVGLNLMAADYVFILDPWWNLAAEIQAINRAHRIGQDKTVLVYRFIMADTIEEKIQNLQNSKSKLAETFINSNNPFSDLSLEEIEKLFS